MSETEKQAVSEQDKLRGVAEYKNVNLGSASKEELVAMLYEACTRAQYQAQDAFRRKAGNEGRQHLRLARDIVGELTVSLDHEAAPELSGNLSRLYSWLLRELGRAGLDRDPERLDATISVTRNLLDGWVEAFRKAGETE